MRKYLAELQYQSPAMKSSLFRFVAALVGSAVLIVGAVSEQSFSDTDDDLHHVMLEEAQDIDAWNNAWDPEGFEEDANPSMDKSDTNVRVPVLDAPEMEGTRLQQMNSETTARRRRHTTQSVDRTSIIQAAERRIESLRSRVKRLEERKQQLLESERRRRQMYERYDMQESPERAALHRMRLQESMDRIEAQLRQYNAQIGVMSGRRPTCMTAACVWAPFL